MTMPGGLSREKPGCRNDAPVRDVYLDYAAATPVDPEVAAVMLPYLTERFWNPSAPYAHAREVRDDVERARGTVARLIGARPDCLVFTAGATEANNLAFAAVEGHVVVDAIEHESVLACAGMHARRTVRVGGDGIVDPKGSVSVVDVAAGVADEVLIQVSYAIGIARPVGLFVDTHGTAKVPLSDAEIAEVIAQIFDLRPRAIEQRLKLREPIYFETASYGHMGRTPRVVKKVFTSNYWPTVVKEVELFTWEKLDYVDTLRKAFHLL